MKGSRSRSLVLKFEHRKDNLRIEGRFSVSDSEGWYDPAEKGAIRELLRGFTPAVNGVTYAGTRSSALSGDWHIVQTGGPDWTDGANFVTGQIRIGDGRAAGTTASSGELTAMLATDRGWRSSVTIGGEYTF